MFDRRSRSPFSPLLLVLSALLVSCGGDSNPEPSAPRAEVTFRMKWPNASANTGGALGTDYVPTTARSVSVAVNDETPQYLNNPATGLALSAPSGNDTFVFQTYDALNGQGNVLSRAHVSQKIVPDTANAIAATLNGVIASVQGTLSNAAPNAGTATNVTLTVSALDADANVIIGPGDYSDPIVLTVNDPTQSGQLSVAPSVLPTPGMTATVTYNGGTLASANIVLTATGVAAVSIPFKPTATAVDFTVPTATNRPQFLAAGPDGNVWVTESPGNIVASVTSAGVFTEYTVPTANSNPQQIISASDGNLWFTEFNANKLGRITTAGVFTEFPTLDSPPPNDNPFGLYDRGDGNIWYVANGSSRIGFQGISSGVAGETAIPTASSGAYGITSAPDDFSYYTESATNKIGRLDNLFNSSTEIALTAGTTPQQIVRGPDGNLWFTESGRSRIGRLSPSSFSVTGEFPTLTPNATPLGITVGSDGALWFTEPGIDKIGRITTGGTVTEYVLPGTGYGLKGITVAADGAIWYCAPGTGLNPGRVGRLVY